MDQPNVIKFAFIKIVTDEFAITEAPFDLSALTNMTLNINFGFYPAEQTIGVKMKFIFTQNEKVIELIAVGCFFKIVPEDWAIIYNSKTNSVHLPHLPALHFASLTVSTARGVLHGKTEGLPVNVLVIPPVNLNDFIKGDVVINPSVQAPA